MGLGRPAQTAAAVLFAILACLAGLAVAKQDVLADLAGLRQHSDAQLSRIAVDKDALNDVLQQCDIVKQLNELQSRTHPETPSWLDSVFATLFPAGPAVNAILATIYISGPPNLILALCPATVDPDSLKIMVAFAVGGLLGDTFFHLLPEIFLGDDGSGGGQMSFVAVSPNRNLLLGAAIMVGFATFIVMDKVLQIMMSGRGGHGHSHGSDDAVESTGASSAIPDPNDDTVRSRQRPAPSSDRSQQENEKAAAGQHQHQHHTNGTGSWLNIIADFTHNITDGLALGSAFYASPAVGATTTLAVFFHEVPHEVGDFALLIKDGFTKKQAILAQFGTALGALSGTLLSIAAHELGHGGDGGDDGVGFFATGLGWSDLILPFTAGTFLYVGTVSVIPDMLKTGPNKRAEVWTLVGQMAAMAVGALIMIAISWS